MKRLRVSQDNPNPGVAMGNENAKSNDYTNPERDGQSRARDTGRKDERIDER